MPEYWQLFLGLIFIAVTLFLPRGVYGLFRKGEIMQPAEGLFTRQLPGDRYRDQTDPVLQLEAINVNLTVSGADRPVVKHRRGRIALCDWPQWRR
jgi:hypothetical protein